MTNLNYVPTMAFELKRAVGPSPVQGNWPHSHVCPSAQYPLAEQVIALFQLEENQFSVAELHLVVVLALDRRRGAVVIFEAARLLYGGDVDAGKRLGARLPAARVRRRHQPRGLSKAVRRTVVVPADESYQEELSGAEYEVRSEVENVVGKVLADQAVGAERLHLD